MKLRALCLLLGHLVFISVSTQAGTAERQPWRGFADLSSFESVRWIDMPGGFDLEPTILRSATIFRSKNEFDRFFQDRQAAIEERWRFYPSRDQLNRVAQAWLERNRQSLLAASIDFSAEALVLITLKRASGSAYFQWEDPKLEGGTLRISGELVETRRGFPAEVTDWIAFSFNTMKIERVVLRIAGQEPLFLSSN